MLTRPNTSWNSSQPPRPAYVLIAVLIVVVVLSLAAYRYSDMMMSEFRATDRIHKNVEAKALADSGIQYTIALLSDKKAITGTLANNPYDNESVFKDHKISDDAKGRFSIVTIDYAADSTTGTLPHKYGVSDESGRININAIVKEAPQAGGNAYLTLMKLPNMTDEIAYAIIDWIDADDNISGTSLGAESAYYLDRQPAYRCKNAPLDSIEELLLIRGITPELLFGNDLNRNGRRDPDEETSGEFSYGWAPYLTVYSREMNVDNDGNPRIFLNKTSWADLQKLYTELKTAVGDELAASLIAYRIYDSNLEDPNKKPGNNAKTGTVADLVKQVDSDMKGTKAITAKTSASSLLKMIGTKVWFTIPAQGMSPSTQIVCNFLVTDANSAKDHLAKMLDKITTKSDTERPGRINVNTASKAVLLTLPGLVASDIDEIMNKQPGTDPSRAADPIYQTPAWLYTEANIALSKLSGLEQFITARTQVYRIQAIGYFEKSGPVARIEAVVDISRDPVDLTIFRPRIIYYRDLSELGRTIDPRSN